MNAVAFSLFGSDPKYCVGAIRNAELVHQLYPGWRMVVFLGEGVPDEPLGILARSGVDFRRVPVCTMIGRALAADLTEYERFVVRDVDSRINEREVAAVYDWISSGVDFHVMRDHPGHGDLILAGMWGGKTGILNVRSLLDQWNGDKSSGTRDVVYGRCTRFLAEMVWPVIKDRVFQHDLCFRDIYKGAKPFPIAIEPRFVGEVYGADDLPRNGDWEQRRDWILNHAE